MKLWARILIGIVAAAIFAALAPLLWTVFVHDGSGLGQSMWMGFLVQLVFLSLLSVVALAVALAPTMLITERLLGTSRSTFVIYGVVTMVVLAGVFRFLLGQTGLWMLLPSVAGVVGLELSEYLTRRPT